MKGGSLSPVTRGELHIFSDFDGTITEKDTLIFLAEHVGGGPQMVNAIGRLIREGKISLRDGIAAEMRSIRSGFDEATQLLREKVNIEPTFNIFAEWCSKEGIPLTVVSAGFHEIIDLFLLPGSFPHLRVLANRVKPDQKEGWRCEFRDSSQFGHDKSRVLQEAKDRGQYVCFIGDGLSDRASAEVADEVFAKHGLAEYCQERKIPYHPFESFDDVRRTLIETAGRRETTEYTE